MSLPLERVRFSAGVLFATAVSATADLVDDAIEKRYDLFSPFYIANPEYRPPPPLGGPTPTRS